MTRQVTLYKIPEVLEVATVLDDSKLEAYKESIKSYNSEKARQTLSKLTKVNGELVGSSPFTLIDYYNKGFLPKGHRLSERTDLEKAVFLDKEFLSDNYTDFGLSIFTPCDIYSPNDLLAKRLAEQLKNRGVELNQGRLILLNDLKLEEDNSEYGLVYALKDEVSKDRILDIRQFKWDYLREGGLNRACFDWNRNWNSNNRNLASSDGDGRITQKVWLVF